MMIWNTTLAIAVLAFNATFAAPAQARPVTQSYASAPQEDIDRVLAPVRLAIVEEQARQADLPPAKNLSEILVRLGDLDQAARREIGRLPLGELEPDRRRIAMHALDALLNVHDQVLQGQLMTLRPKDGWFLRSEVGPAGSTAAFLIIQHAGPGLQRELLPVFAKLAAAGELDPADYALLFDRVAVEDGRPQRFGSQMICRGGRLTLAPLEDAAQVDAWRAGVGLTQTLQQYLEIFASYPPCGDDT